MVIFYLFRGDFMIFHQPSNSMSNYSYNAVFYTDKVWDFHFHKNFELIYVLEGAVNCTINNKPYRLSAGDFGLCLPYDMHKYLPECNTHYWVLVFSEDFVSYFSNQLVGKMSDGFRFRCDEVEEKYIRSHIIDNQSPTIITLKSCLYAVCERYKNSVNLVKNDKRNSIMCDIADYISENHTGKLSLQSLAEWLGYDYHYVSRLFHQMFNMTFSDFTNIYRLETAVRLLKDTDKSITYIAYESGFQSIRTFNDFFKKNTGLSPSVYRKASRN